MFYFYGFPYGGSVDLQAENLSPSSPIVILAIDLAGGAFLTKTHSVLKIFIFLNRHFCTYSYQVFAS